jgi:hypothetical protein
MPDQSELVDPDPPIIITGGSVTLEFDPLILLPDGIGKFFNAQKVIKRVEIYGTGVPNYDESATSDDITIKVTYGNP